MYRPDTSWRGDEGEMVVALQFHKLKWSPVYVGRGDVGTDLVFMPFDLRGAALALAVGAQVKTGRAKYFSEQANGPDGQLRGWWYREGSWKHFDYWLSHALPHLLILHDDESGQSYWVHVVREDVIKTRAGAKILVPVGNTVDKTNLQSLLKVAGSKRSRTAWEGSAWSGADHLAPDALLRHALIVPRVIAPHPNQGTATPLSPPQAAAMLVQGRLFNFDLHAEAHDSVPKLADACNSKTWDWRFVGALGTRMSSGEHDALLTVAAEAPDAASRAAAVSAAAGTELEDALADSALDLLQTTMRNQDFDPVDYAWLQVQEARALVELGRAPEARTAAFNALSVGATYPDDLTAVAIAGAAAACLFTTAEDWLDQDIGQVISASDTAAAWWRAQTVSWGLIDMADREFLRWTQTPPNEYSFGDPAHNYLLSASVTATLLGDHDTWRKLTGLVGCDGLMRLSNESSAEEVASCLGSLRRAGQAKDLQVATEHLLDDGPWEALVYAISAVELPRSTRTTGRADLTLLRYGADALTPAIADEQARQVLKILSGDSTFLARTQGGSTTLRELPHVLSALAGANTAPVVNEMIDTVCALPTQTDELTMVAWSQWVQQLPEGAWTEANRRAAGLAAARQEGSLKLHFLGVASPVDQGAGAFLVAAAGAGSLEALAALGDVTRLPRSLIDELLPSLATMVERQIQDASKGRFDGGHDLGRALALLTLWHKRDEGWPVLNKLIADANVSGGQKIGAMRLLARLSQHIPTEYRSQLASAARSATEPGSALRRRMLGDASGAAKELLASLAEDEIQQNTDLLSLIAGNVRDKISAASMAARSANPRATGLLLALANDQHFNVRAHAAYGLAQMFARGQGGEEVSNAVARCVLDPGLRVPEAVASALVESIEPTPAADILRQQLSGHQAAAVRRAADRSLHPSPADTTNPR